jgi:phosphate transport system substrate-binding protein
MYSANMHFRLPEGIGRRLRCLCVALLWPLSANTVAAVDPGLPEYERASGVAGALSSAGSDTLANLMSLWAEAFKRNYPNVLVQVQAAGSATAPPALTQGTASLGPMSREMKDAERAAFESRFGYPPTAIPVAIDAVAVFVHRDNPVAGLTIEQVDAIFSATRRCGLDRPLRFWGELGLEGPWAERHIQLFGRNSVSGTYGFFKREVLCNGDFSSRVNEQPGSSSVVQAVATALNGIGYSALGFRTASVRTVPLAPRPGQPYVMPSEKTATNGEYPLARFMYIYVNKLPGKPLPPLEREFLTMVLSREGQEAVVKDGYTPLPAGLAAQAREALLL